jgi:hypothetical protein
VKAQAKFTRFRNQRSGPPYPLVRPRQGQSKSTIGFPSSKNLPDHLRRRSLRPRPASGIIPLTNPRKSVDVKIARILGGLKMRRATICVLGVVLASWAISFGQDSKETSVSYPKIVARVNLTGQTKPIATTTLFAPKKDGLFRFSGVMVVTVPSNQAGTWTTTIGFAPDSGASTQDWLGANSAAVGGGADPSALTVRSNAGIALTYSVTASQGNPQGSTYELFFTVERLE